MVLSREHSLRSRRTPKPITQIFLAVAFACSLMTFVPATHAQSKNTDRKKEFGKSLKRFEKKDPPKTPRKDELRDDDGDVIKVATNLVVVDLLVVNAAGKAILGLKQDDFVVTENGMVQDVALFEPGESPIPRKIVLIIQVGGIPSFAEGSLEAAKKLVEMLRPIDQMAIADTDVKLRLDFTSDKKLLTSTLELLKRVKKHSRHDYSTLMAALAELFDVEDKRPIVIQQIEGGELHAMRKQMSEPFPQLCKRGVTDYCPRNFTLADVRDMVARSKATIYTVVPFPQVVGVSRDRQVAAVNLYYDRLLIEAPISRRYSEAEKIEIKKRYTDSTINEYIDYQTALAEITGLSGGYTSFLETPADAEPIYDEILKVIENRYTVGFYPKDDSRDGKMRTVKITIRNRPEYTVIGRRTYFPAER